VTNSEKQRTIEDIQEWGMKRKYFPDHLEFTLQEPDGKRIQDIISQDETPDITFPGQNAPLRNCVGQNTPIHNIPK